MKRILILCTPRTGSTLLMLSLGQHRLAKVGSELFNKDTQKYHREDWNIAKLMYHEAYQFDFHNTDNLLLIHLFRIDWEAQLASWRKACKTGVWIAGDTNGPTYKESDNWLKGAVRDSKPFFDSVCDLRFSYETLIRLWPECIRCILKEANWPDLHDLPMVIPPIPK